jgi:DNA-binding IclR family transcriptional regulator
LRILETLHREGPITITEVADTLDRSPSNVLAHLTTLREQEFVVKEEQQYRPGLRYFEIGEMVKHSYGLFTHGRDAADELAEETGEYVWLMVEEYGNGYYLYKSGGERAVETGAYTIGSSWHLNTIAGGKAVLAHMDETEVDEILDKHGFGSMTDNSITDRAELKEELDTIREDGIAYDFEEAAIGIRSIAAPVFGVDGMIGAIAISGPPSRIEGERLAETLPRALHEKADIIRVKYNGANAAGSN